MKKLGPVRANRCLGARTVGAHPIWPPAWSHGMDAFDEVRNARSSARTRGSMALASPAARSAHRRSRSDCGGAAAPIASVRVVAVMRNAVEAAPQALEAAQRAVAESAFAVYSVKKAPQRARGCVSTKHIKARRCGRAAVAALDTLAPSWKAAALRRSIFAVPIGQSWTGGTAPLRAGQARAAPPKAMGRQPRALCAHWPLSCRWLGQPVGRTALVSH